MAPRPVWGDCVWLWVCVCVHALGVFMHWYIRVCECTYVWMGEVGVTVCMCPCTGCVYALIHTGVWVYVCVDGERLGWLCVCPCMWMSVRHRSHTKGRLAAGVFVNSVANIKPTEPCLMLTWREHGVIVGIDIIPRNGEWEQRMGEREKEREKKREGERRHAEREWENTLKTAYHGEL